MNRRQRAFFLGSSALLGALGCGARTELPTSNSTIQEGGAAPTPQCGGGLAPLSLTAPLAKESTDEPGEIYGVLRDAAGGLYVWGAGQLPLCAQSKTLGRGGHFIARYTADGEIVWERRFQAENWNRELQVVSAPDGGVYAAVGGSAKTFVATDANIVLVRLDANGDILRTAPLGYVSDFGSLCASPSGRILVTGTCDPTADPGCVGSGARLSWYDSDLSLAIVEPIAGAGTAGFWGPGACAFDDQQAIVIGSGGGTFLFEDAPINLGIGGTLVARIDEGHHVIASTTLTAGDFHDVATGIDAKTRDVFAAVSHPPSSVTVTRLTPTLATEWTDEFDIQGHELFEHFEPGANGSFLFSIQYSGGPMTLANHVFDLPSQGNGNRHAVGALAPDGSLRWSLEDASFVRFVAEDQTGRRFFGGSYDALTPPEHGGPWPSVQGQTGFLVGLEKAD